MNMPCINILTLRVINLIIKKKEKKHDTIFILTQIFFTSNLNGFYIHYMFTVQQNIIPIFNLIYRTSFTKGHISIYTHVIADCEVLNNVFSLDGLGL